ncbi:MAG: alanine--tRNA ligase [Candidatus Nanopelagicales bacterium]|jgi:alanyl-tRNA synthetase|nr:alanine--tRNA ligase [Candidatus Nanopelagicales bacterium]
MSFEYMDSAEIRRRFLAFFADRGHTPVPSASLLLDDPTLLFVNAGMVPFKPYFLGQATPPYPRATSVQKCVRTLDIEEVGKTTRHASFFQMAGNFSFGDYFKAGAIPLAWELLTGSLSNGGYGFPEDKLWVTVLGDDDEAIDIWHTIAGVPMERIQRRGLKDNYWHMGVPGPGGPCSEIYFDRGPEHGREGGPEADEDRYLEVWNLVFMQSELSEVRTKVDFDIRGDLPAKNIDTGMGLERMAAILQGVDNIYEIDTTRHILDRATALSGARYGTDHRSDVDLRVVADHARTCAFLIGDGVLPGNEGRGYVLRRIMRRVVQKMRLLGAHDPSMGELVGAAIEAMGPQYPELVEAAGRITSIAVGEEASFLETLGRGTTLLESAVARTKASGATVLPGDEAFTLHDTYGFPIEITLEMARDAGVEVDEPGFRRLMAEQKERAKADARARKAGLTPATVYREVMDAAGITDFTGYTEVVSEGTLRGLLVDGQPVPSAGPGTHVEAVLDRTPFYAEGGGQIGDQGVIRLADGTMLEVYDVQQPVPGLVVHRATVADGEAALGAAAIGQVDLPRRLAISRAHTATHMIHKAFREILGETATQMGSENAPGRLRFDFPNPAPVPASVLHDVEDRVNTLLLEDLEVTAAYMTQAEARAVGAMALFGEKYGDSVRVVSVGDWARELCGGTHTNRSGQLGVVKFLSEASIGSGVRRVEALVGADAYRHLAREHLLLNALAQQVKARPEELPDRIGALLDKLKEAESTIAQMRKAAVVANIEGVIGTRHDIGDARVWTYALPEPATAAELREATNVALQMVSTDIPVVLVGAASDGAKASLLVTVNTPGQAAGLSAREILAAALPAVEGRGGGKADAAQGGGAKPAGITDALRAAREFLAARA